MTLVIDEPHRERYEANNVKGAEEGEAAKLLYGGVCTSKSCRELRISELRRDRQNGAEIAGAKCRIPSML